MKRFSSRDRNTLAAMASIGEADRKLLHTFQNSNSAERKSIIKEARTTLKTVTDSLIKTLGIANSRETEV